MTTRITARALHYEADGLSMVGHLFSPEADGPPRPAVLVFPEALGIGDHNKQWAERLARERGCVALACDLHGSGRLCANVEEALPFLQPLLSEPARARTRTRETLDALARQPGVDPQRLAAIGFCMGGTLSFELALSGAELKAAIGFHSRLAVSAPAGDAVVKAAILALIGADDPLVPPEHRDAFETMLKRLDVDWQLHLFGGVRHSFTNPEADRRGAPDVQRYDARATKRAWKHMTDLFDDVFA